MLLQYAIAEFGVNEVDVNEQNPQGVAFYRHMGFEQVGRSELDGQGNPFPLLHMRLSGYLTPLSLWRGRLQASYW